MTDKKECPLCGKIINENEVLCDECQNHVDNQYAIELLNQDSYGGEETSPVGKPDKEVAQEPEITVSGIEDADTGKDMAEPVKRKRISIGMVFLLIGCLIIITVGVIGSLKVIEHKRSIENEDRFWNISAEENTQLSYSKYLVAFPEGRYAEDASLRIQELKDAEVNAWQKLKGSSDINDYYTYLSENPESPYLEQARFLMDSLSWLSTLQDDTEDAYKAYLENVKLGNLSGKHTEEAEERFNYLSQIINLEGKALDSVKLVLNDFFKVLSENNSMQLLKKIAPRAYYYTKDTTNINIVSLIDKEFSNTKVREIKYIPQSKSIRVKRDNQNILFVDLNVEKEITYNTKVKKGKVTEYKKQKTIDTLKIEIDDEKRVRSIKKK